MPSPFKNFVIDMKHGSRQKIIVFLSSYNKTNSLVEEINKLGGEYKAYIPKHLVCITGIVTGIPTNLDVGEIKEDTESDVPILDIDRMHRGKEKIPINKIRITFRAQQLPDAVRIFGCPAKVRPFTPSVLLCQKCLRFGHNTQNCRGAKRCDKCAEQHDNKEDFENCHNPIKCANCRSLGHSSTDIACPEKKRQQNIKMLMSKRNWTYAEAREQVSTVTQNLYAPLQDAAEFPTPAESFASMTQGNYRWRDPLREQWITTNQERKSIQPAVKLYKDPSPSIQKGKRARFENPAKQTMAEIVTQERDNIIRNDGSTSLGSGLQNKWKVDDKERWSNEVRESQISFERTFQEKMMSFYTEFIGLLGPQEQIKDLFNNCTKKHFNLANSVVLSQK